MFSIRGTVYYDNGLCIASSHINTHHSTSHHIRSDQITSYRIASWLKRCVVVICMNSLWISPCWPHGFYSFCLFKYFINFSHAACCCVLKYSILLLLPFTWTFCRFLPFFHFIHKFSILWAHFSSHHLKHIILLLIRLLLLNCVLFSQSIY